LANFFDFQKFNLNAILDVSAISTQVQKHEQMVYLEYADNISAFRRINCIEDDVDGFVKIAIIDLSRHLGFKNFKLNSFQWINKIQIGFLKFVENCSFDS
jgi:hypothetical protein